MTHLANEHPEWALGYEDETWWSRFAPPSLHAWRQEGDPLRMIEQAKEKDDPDAKALACYGMLLRCGLPEAVDRERIWLRFVDGRPVSAITVEFLEWCCRQLRALGIRVLVMIWDNASWHISKTVRAWIRQHNRRAKEEGEGVRILACLLPVKSPWLNPIEPKWLHGKRRVAEPDGTLSAQALADRICATFGCTHEPHLSIPANVP